MSCQLLHHVACIDPILALLLALQLKHWIADFLLQGPYQYENKGIYGHLGGIIHSAIHAAFTFVILSQYFQFEFALACTYATVEAVIHYHIDWSKVQLTRLFKLAPTTSEQFWWLLGFDQLLHQITYLGMAYFAIRPS